MLLRRGKIFYCRVFIPLELRKLIGRAELKKSLCTSNRTEAKTAAVSLVHIVETAFFRMRSGMLSDRELEMIAGQLIAEFTGSIAEHRGQRKSADEFLSSGKIPIGLDLHLGGLELIDSSLTYIKPADAVQALSGSYRGIVAALETELQTGQFSSSTRMLARRLVADNNLTIEIPPSEWFNENEPDWFTPPPLEFGRLCETTVTALIDSYSVVEELALVKRDTALQQKVAARIEAARIKPKLSDLWDAYCRFKKVKGKWSVKTEGKNQDTFDEAVKILSDKELGDYTQEDSVTYLAALEKNGNSASTRTGKVEMLSSLFKHALKTPESIDQWKVRGNPFTEMQAEDTVPVNQKKLPYTTEDIHKLLSGLLGVHKLKEPHRFWVPLIALYSGMRQNEICQLRTTDIEIDGNIPVFQIRHNPAMRQTVKAKESRTCPIHPMLLRLGFLGYVGRQREGKQEMLFSTLTYSETKGWTGKVRGWWNEQFQVKCIDDTTSKSFHSWRGTFIDWFKQNGAYRKLDDRMILKSMIGHDGDESVTSKHYEQGYPLATQIRILRKLDYKIEPALIEALAQK
jgi:integrase